MCLCLSACLSVCVNVCIYQYICLHVSMISHARETEGGKSDSERVRPQTYGKMNRRKESSH